MLVQEFEGRTKDEAIKMALETLNLTEDQIRVESIEEGKTSFFGFKGSRPAKIRVFYEEIEGVASLKAREFLEGLFDQIGLDVDIVFQQEDKDKIYLKILSDKSGLIIGRHGQHLESVQFLTNLVVNRQDTAGKKIVIDIEGYRAKKEDAIRNLALKTAGSVKVSKKPVYLDPMNPYERRIVHLTLQDFNGVSTQSEGEGIYKRIKVSPA